MFLKIILLCCMLFVIESESCRGRCIRTSSGSNCIGGGHLDPSCPIGSVCCPRKIHLHNRRSVPKKMKREIHLHNRRSVPKKMKRAVRCATGNKCSTKGGHCMAKSDSCMGGKVKPNACPGSGCVCCIKKRAKKIGNGMQNGNSNGCTQKPSCKQRRGKCIGSSQPCQGKVKSNLCQNNKCKCCIPKGANSKGKKQPKKGRKIKKDKGCKKKKKCKGFCVNSDEECLGERDPTGCKGKHCACCTLEVKKNGKDSGENSPPFEDSDYNNYYDYSGDYYYYGDYGGTCSGKNVNGSCEDEGCFICDDDQCHPQYYKCDQMKDCDDGSDELGCPHPMPDSCPKDYKWVVRSCYQVVARPSSWADARMVCWALNGDLAHIYVHKLFSAYMKAFHETIQAVYWVGIHQVDGNFTWVNGTILPENSTLWGSSGAPAQGTEGEDCVVLDLTTDNKMLHTTSCEVDTYNNKPIYSVCEYVANDYHDYYHYVH